MSRLRTKFNDLINMTKTEIVKPEQGENKTKKKTISLATIRKMSVLDIIGKVLDLTSDKPFALIVDRSSKKDQIHPGDHSKYLSVLSEKLKITKIQALFLSIFVDQCDDNSIRYRDLAHHFDDCKTINIIRFQNDITNMVEKGIINQGKGIHNNMTYYIPQSTLKCLCNDDLPSHPEHQCPDLSDWLESIDNLLKNASEDDWNDREFEIYIKENIKKNLHFPCVQKIRDLNLDSSSLRLFLITALKCIVDDDNCIGRWDVAEYFNKFKFQGIVMDIENNTHPLIEKKLIEHVCEDGQADPKHWCLTSSCKSDIFAEFNLDVPKVSAKLKYPDSITQMELFYDAEISKQIDNLKNFLEADRMNAIMERLSKKGMRKGFACLFYGGPGTGKTETVLQLARMTSRPVMQVDIATIRDKFVGETEKRIKGCFDRYKQEYRDNKIAPILFFNEADALFTRRNEKAEYSVDKMENAMQNIILQEMENLEGILIATTNLTGSLDPAFERRFLFKIEFTKPSPEARRHIWQAKLPELSDADALMLAKRFDFSGGQIENIARKHEIDDILAERDTLDIDSIIESCRHESLNKQENMSRIGFIA